jgi:soluble lytic murein transglycosylase-like protein
MRMLVLAIPLLALASPATAREHSHHWRASAHFHHSHHSHHGYAARRHEHGRFASRHGYRRAAVAYDVQYGEARPSVVQQTYAPGFGAASSSHGALDEMIARHARANGVPESLVHRVVRRESGYNPRAVGRGGAMGLMQIKYATARAMGYGGSPSGLLDPETNLTYAVRYLAGAYRASGGSAGGAVSNYARGYYYAAKRRGFSPYQGGAAYARTAYTGATQTAYTDAAWPTTAYASAPSRRQRRH